MKVSPQKFLFCTLRAFHTDVGETLRIYGIINALAAAGHEVVLVSNAVPSALFHPAVRHYSIGYEFTRKRWLQGLTSLLPASVVRRLFTTLFKALDRALAAAGAIGETVFFFDYLDNTVGYILQQTGSIKGYINDVHGIVTIEFLNNRQETRGILKRGYYYLKFLLADWLDKKVFEGTAAIIYGSDAMQRYFENRYSLADKPRLVLPYLLDAFSLNRIPDPDLTQRLQDDLNLKKRDFVFLFAGSYKATAGVNDLIATFDQLWQTYQNCRLILIGDGPHRESCEQQARSVPAADAILFQDSVPYSALPSWYSLAQVIVCPDRDNPFSQYVVHIKYLDALASGKLVINGAFKSVLELNAMVPLSPLFIPSSQQDLYRVLQEAYSQYHSLSKLYEQAGKTVREHFTYTTQTEALVHLQRAATGHPV